LLGAAFFWTAGRLFKLPAATCGGLMLYGSLGNTSFVGLPMIEAFYGAGYLATGLLIDQLGSYLVLSTVGIMVASLYSSGQSGFDLSGTLRRCLRFPPFVAIFAAIALMPFDYPAEVDTLLVRLGGTLAPLALISVGYQLRLRQLEGQWLPLGMGLGFKLLLAPLAVWLLYGGVFSRSGPEFQVTIFEAAMAPMIGASIVAMEHKLNAPLATLMIGIGIPLSFLTLPLWHAFL
jgi:predicted permease